MILEKRNYHIFDLIRLAFKVAPGWSFVILVLQLISALSPAVLIIVTANFIDTSLAVLEGTARSIEMYMPIFMLGILTSFRGFANVIDQYIRSKVLIATRLTYRIELVEKRGKLMYQYIEDQDTYDLIKRVTDPADTQIVEQYENTIGLLDIIIQVSSLLGILLVNVWWAPLFILTLSIPTFYFGAKAGKTIYDAGRDISKIERKAWYLTEVCSGRDSTLERTLYGYGVKMTEELWDRFEYARIHTQAVRRKVEIKMVASGMLVSLTAGSVMMILLQPVATGTLSIGLFISLVTACIALTNTLSTSLPNRLSELSKHMEYLKELGQFCQLEETEDALKVRCEKGFDFKKLEFKNVSFTYPGTKKIILKNVNFTITFGKHYAFVGVNGAGKTTVIKLLTGQYQNYDGEILLNDKELRQYSASKLKAFSSVAYQDFAKYQLSLKENMLIGNLNRLSDEDLSNVVTDLDLDELVSRLPKGLDTSLGKIAEDGVDVSGGQWQRIALARTIINPAPIKILDEPTAALDPLSESHLYEQFEKIIDNKTSIFISHRLGSIKLADDIFVFDGGTIVEEGNHKMLMSKKGIYAEMYTSQLEWYQTSAQEVETNAYE